jgi:hypothetical protein
MGCVGCGLGIESRFAFCPKYGAGLNGAVAHVGAVVGTRPYRRAADLIKNCPHANGSEVADIKLAE